MRFVFFLPGLWLAASLAAAPPLPKDPAHRALVERFRAAAAEAEQLEREFRGGIEGPAGMLAALGKVAFILRHAQPRRYLHFRDQDFVYSAVQGLDEAQLEENLPGIVNYIRLAAAARFYNWRARHLQPMFGERAGADRVEEIARKIFDFRAIQLAGIQGGRVAPSRVLTAANLGELGDPRLFEELTEAYRAGQKQFSFQRNAAGFGAFSLHVLLGAGLASVFLRRQRAVTVIRL